ncbi:MAG: hypothetical protein HFH85_06330 [Lachnospiraceae bacterium]|jgi:DNA mismatch repair ATPase MutS|nr:hypothetical protein [Lachnospiraceae bacterium]
MKACLLYQEKEWANEGHYFEEGAVIRDLGLDTLFWAASRDVIRDEEEKDRIIALGDPDAFLESIMKKVMMVPLETDAEILYRQEILRDCLAQESFICELYEYADSVLKDWDRLGRRAGNKAGSRNSARALIMEIHVLQLFVISLAKLKAILAKYADRLHAEGLLAFRERLYREFSDEKEEDLQNILKGIAFYANDKEHEDGIWGRMVKKPRIVLGCSLGDGLKLGDFRLEEVATETKKYRRPESLISRAQNFAAERSKTLVNLQRGTELAAQAEQLEFNAVRYIVACCEPFVNAFSGFFNQLHVQAAFYRGAVNVAHHLARFRMGYCYPKAGEQETLRFRELKEMVMGLEQKRDPVGNSCDIAGKRLLIVTGANQGGKSTFLRSIGIAQVMMQCGMFVAAQTYESGIFPKFFTHFTRREDSAMNSGRLDEELSRMSRIVDQLGDASMVLLNESFASTTEKEGSVIAYDITKALTEAGVKVLTVTHLLSFAKKVYEEYLAAEDSAMEFLSAERTDEGKRTFKMIQHAPELTSFGLDLYDKLIGPLEKSGI